MEVSAFLYMVLSVTRLYAGILSIIWVALMMAVVAGRAMNNVKMGDGGLPTLATRIRGHANFVEVVPLMLIILAAVDLESDVPDLALHLFAGIFTLGRLVHMLGFLGETPNTPCRIVGTFCAIIPTFSLAMYGMLGWNLAGHVVVVVGNVGGAVVRLIVIPLLSKPAKALDAGAKKAPLAS